jgi:hypothetical protein
VYDALDMKAVGLNVTYLAVLSVAYFLIAVIVDFSIANPWLRRRILGIKMPRAFATSSPVVSPHEDVDVAAERARVAQGGDPSDVLTLKARALLGPVGCRCRVVALCSCIAMLLGCRFVVHTQHPASRTPPRCHSLCCVPRVRLFVNAGAAESVPRRQGGGAVAVLRRAHRPVLRILGEHALALVPRSASCMFRSAVVAAV